MKQTHVSCAHKKAEVEKTSLVKSGRVLDPCSVECSALTTNSGVTVSLQSWCLKNLHTVCFLRLKECDDVLILCLCMWVSSSNTRLPNSLWRDSTAR